MYEAAKAGEASARPHLRPVTFRDDHCQRTVRGALNAAAASSGIENVEIPSNVIVFLADGEVHGNESKLTKGLVDQNGKAIAKNQKPLSLFTSESSEAEWRGKLSGTRRAIVYPPCKDGFV